MWAPCVQFVSLRAITYFVYMLVTVQVDIWARDEN